MTASVTHDLYIKDSPRCLEMANSDDPWYIQTFKNWQEVEAFIAEMRSKAEEAFGPGPDKPGGLTEEQLDAAILAAAHECDSVAEACRYSEYDPEIGRVPGHWKPHVWVKHIVQRVLRR